MKSGNYRGGGVNTNYRGSTTGGTAYLFYFSAILGLSALCAAMAYSFGIRSLPVLWLLAWSGAGFILSGFDKAIAGKGGLRVPERILLAGALLGGAAGLLAGMKVFRHKTRKAGFQLVLTLIIVIQVALWHFFLRNFFSE